MVGAVEFAAVGFGSAATPLLEEERDAGGDALAAQIPNPRGVHGLALGPLSPPATSQLTPVRLTCRRRPISGLALTRRTAACSGRSVRTREIALFVSEMLDEPRREGGDLVGLGRFEVQRWYRRGLVRVIEQRWRSSFRARFSFSILSYYRPRLS